MSKLFITSDTHISHKRILHYCNRPFKDVHEMNKVIAENWNSVVSPEDTVIHIGDVGFGPVEDLKDYFSRLNGRKLLIRGNHDGSKKRMTSIGFELADNFSDPGCDEYFRLYSSGTQTYCFIHDYWKNSHLIDEPSEDHIICYGHVHNTPVDWHKKYMVNCCVENWNYTPAPMKKVVERAMNG